MFQVLVFGMLMNNAAAVLISVLYGFWPWHQQFASSYEVQFLDASVGLQTPILIEKWPHSVDRWRVFSYAGNLHCRCMEGAGPAGPGGVPGGGGPGPGGGHGRHRSPSHSEAPQR